MQLRTSEGHVCEVEHGDEGHTSQNGSEGEGEADGEGDRERVRDFLRALDEWTWQFKKPSEWTRVGERAANLACQAFTKDIKAAKSIIESVLDKSQSLRDRGLTSRTVIVNGIRIENATIESLLPIMVNAQSLYFPAAHDEL